MPHLYPYQDVAVTHLAIQPIALLADDMGLGKTAVAVRAADAVGAKKILAVVPAIARIAWQREFERWQEIDRSIHVISSGMDIADLSADVIVVSYALASTPSVLAALRQHRFDVTIADECQALKSRDTKRTLAVYGRDGLITRTKRLWLLSGTPAPNHAAELWPHLRAARLTQLDYWAFTKRYCWVRETQFGLQITGTNTVMMPELANTLRPFMLRRTMADALPDLPPLRWGLVPVEPDTVPPQPDVSPEAQAVLDKLNRDEQISAVEQMHLATLRRWTGVAKVPAIVDLIRSDLEHINKLVTFFWHRVVGNTIAAALGDDAAVIDGSTPQKDRQALIDTFQNTPAPCVLLVQIVVAGTAITLHRASHCFFAESSWVPGDMVQCAKRLHRIGQGHSVLARVISLAGSIDEAVSATALWRSWTS
jgi:SWI/SNF-related matrix-associated actin-dependent regulator 1 of chromatin subfamily A